MPYLNDNTSAAAYWDIRASNGYLPLSPVPYVLDRTRRLDEILISYLAPPNIHTVLDFGCGPGRQLGRLFARLPTKQYVGIDISPRFVAAAKREYPHITFSLSSEAAADTNSIDFAFSVTTLAHIPDTELPEVFRVLAGWIRASGGLLLFEQTASTRTDGRMHSRRLADEYEAQASAAGFALERRTLFHYRFFDRFITQRFAPWYLRRVCDGKTAEDRWAQANQSWLFRFISRLAIVLSGNPLHEGASGYGYTMLVFRRK
jgi:SAM-dependent methyltransferase